MGKKVRMEDRVEKEDPTLMKSRIEKTSRIIHIASLFREWQADVKAEHKDGKAPTLNTKIFKLHYSIFPPSETPSSLPYT